MSVSNMSLSNIAKPAPVRAAAQRTAAENLFVESFASASAQLPGDGWVARVRQQGLAAYERSGLPTRRTESYKYTDLREKLREAFAPATAASAQTKVTIADIDDALGALAAIPAQRFVFVDGCHRPELSRTDALGDGIEAMPLAPLLGKAPGWLEGKFAAGRLGIEDAVLSLNTAFMSDGLLLKVKPGITAPQPVMIVSVRASAEPCTSTTRHVIAVEPGARLTLIEAHVALPGAAAKGLTNALVDVTVADDAGLVHIKHACEGPQAQHLSNLIASVGRDASYRVFQLSAGIGLARNSIGIKLAGQGSTLDVSGAFLGRGASHIDTTLIVDHAVPHCTSRELFKGVLDDRARGVFQGKVIVRPGADKTDGKQMARVLMLSEDAEFDSKPELEIFADDVACGHGATAAELDQGLMFYCQSRGIPAAEARALLIEAFIGEAIEKVENEAIRSALMDHAQAWLRAEAA